MSSRPIRPGEIAVSDVSRRFQVVHDRSLTLKETILRRRRKTVGDDYWALRNVNIEVPTGQAVGIVGRNGSGKSTLLKTIAGILPPTTGSVASSGTMASILELGAGFSPDFSGLENIYLNAAILGIRETEVRASLDEIVAFAELEDFIHAPVRTYSSGMQVRLAFSIASHVRADILLLDEVFAVGDESFQRKCLGRMFEFRRAGGTLLFVSHDASAVERICDRVVLLEHGEVVADGPTERVLPMYHKLLSDQPSRSGERDAQALEESENDQDSWGSREVVITDVRLLDGEARASKAFRTGDRLTIEATFDVRDPIDSLNFGIAIHSVDGAHISGTGATREGVTIPPKKGVGVVRFAIPELALNAGRFTVTVACGPEDESDAYHWRDRCIEFDVYPRAPRVGLVALDYEVTLDALPPQGARLAEVPLAAESSGGRS